MKKLIAAILLSFIVAVPSVLSQEAEEDTSYCELTDLAARKEIRITNIQGTDENYQRMMGPGECTENGICIISESFNECGGITQNIGRKGNGECKFTLQWIPILSPEYGVLFGIYKIKRCPSII